MSLSVLDLPINYCSASVKPTFLKISRFRKFYTEYINVILKYCTGCSLKKTKANSKHIFFSFFKNHIILKTSLHKFSTEVHSWWGSNLHVISCHLRLQGQVFFYIFDRNKIYNGLGFIVDDKELSLLVVLPHQRYQIFTAKKVQGNFGCARNAITPNVLGKKKYIKMVSLKQIIGPKTKWLLRIDSSWSALVLQNAGDQNCSLMRCPWVKF